LLPGKGSGGEFFKYPNINMYYSQNGLPVPPKEEIIKPRDYSSFFKEP
jgi:hypothetical protein